MFRYLLELFYPTKCLFCHKPLERGHVDLCPKCRAEAPEFTKAKNKFSFIARWTSVWYYKDKARRCILRYKFYKYRSYCTNFGRLLAMKLQQEQMDDFDLLTWVPISSLRRFKRHYDQCELLAQVVGKELGAVPVKTLKKTRHNRAQSTILDHSMRRANVLGAYRILDPGLVRDKRILLLDDIVTSGSTASECARVLLTAGAKEVQLGTIAFSDHNSK